MATIIEFIHALFIVLLVIGTPFLFIKRWKKIRLATALYSIVFIIVNRVSHYTMGECVWTRLARVTGGNSWGDELFLSKISRIVFGCIPSSRQLVYFEQGAIFIVCLGIIVSFIFDWRKKR